MSQSLIQTADRIYMSIAALAGAVIVAWASYDIFSK